MLFNLKTTSNKVNDAYQIAGEILASGDISDRISSLKSVTYTKKTPLEIAQELSYHVDLIVSGVTPRILVQSYFDSSKSVVATTFSHKNGIFVNENNYARFNKSTYIGNGAHEFGHLPMGFGHGNNFTQDTWKGRLMCKASGDFADKNLSVPYLLGKYTIQIAKNKGKI